VEIAGFRIRYVVSKGIEDLIFTVTLNPAIDKILFLDEFHRSRTNRLSQTLETIGGKGTHVSINLILLGVQSTVLGIVLGENGKKIIRILERWGMDVQLLYYDMPGMESRTNYEVVERNGAICSMLTERGPILPENITDDLLKKIEGLVKAGDMLVLTGDASNVEDTAIYSKITRIVKERGGKVFLDASGTYLLEGLKSSPFLIKPNFEELCFLAGSNLKTEEDIVTAIQGLERFKTPIISMTWGKNGAIVKHYHDFFRIMPIAVQAVNEGGCGDAFLSGIIAGIDKSLSIEETLKTAAAVSAAAAESESTAGFDQTRASELTAKAVVYKIR
jgi:1-phosphofructokinase family hexose kinase